MGTLVSLPDPLPEVLEALKRANAKWDAHGEGATVKDVRKHLRDDGRGLPVAYALTDLVKMGAATVVTYEGQKRYRAAR